MRSVSADSGTDQASLWVFISVGTYSSFFCVRNRFMCNLSADRNCGDLSGGSDRFYQSVLFCTLSHGCIVWNDIRGFDCRGMYFSAADTDRIFSLIGILNMNSMNLHLNRKRCQPAKISLKASFVFKYIAIILVGWKGRYCISFSILPKRSILPEQNQHRLFGHTHSHRCCLRQIKFALLRHLQVP